MQKSRSRLLYFFIVLLVIGVGLLSRSGWAPEWTYSFLGDLLYATMAYFIFAFLFPNNRSNRLLLYAIVFCFSIEFLQLVNVDWMVDLRSNKYAKLVLGNGFLWADLFYYAIGAILGLIIDNQLSLKK